MKPEYIKPFCRHEVTNGDFYEILKRQAEKKVVKVTEVLVDPKTDHWMKRITVAVVISLAIVVLIGVVVGVMR